MGCTRATGTLQEDLSRAPPGYMSFISAERDLIYGNQASSQAET